MWLGKKLDLYFWHWVYLIFFVAFLKCSRNRKKNAAATTLQYLL